MIRYVSFVFAAATILAAAPQQVFRGTTDAVYVFTTVIDKDGRLVPNLTKPDFEVRDDGKPQPLTLFDNTPVPIRLVVMLDVSGSMEGNLPLLRAASEQLIARLGAKDVARIGTFGNDVKIGPAFTNDRAELLRALPDFIQPDAPTPLWRAIDEAMDAFMTPGDGRSVVLVLSDGKDSGPSTLRRRMTSQVDVIERARRDDVMIYGVGMRSRARPTGGAPPMFGRGGSLENPLVADLPDPGLARVAEEAGGGYIELRSLDLGAAFAQVIDELHSQYLLGFAPPKRDGKAHEVDVRVNQKGMKARARKSYVAPKG